MPKLLIIADDLTGAIDTGVQLVGQGVSTLVIPELSQRKGPFDLETIVINTETRHCLPDKAADAVARAVAFGQELGVQHFYKKTDSTLRGNLGSEFQAQMIATREKQLFFVPAFPRLQRTTHLGQQYVNGVELHKSNFGNDPLNPVSTSDIATLIRHQAQLDTHHVLVGEFGGLSALQVDGVYIFDCASDDDMRSIASALREVTPLTNLAGSAGFAPYLSSLLNLKSTTTKPHFCLPVRMLAVNGSLNLAAQRQLRFASRSGFVVTQIDPCHLLQKHLGCEEAWADVLEEIGKQLRTENNVALTTSSNRRSQADASTMLAISERLGEQVSTIVCKEKIQLVTVFGGDTLSAITRSLHCRRIMPIAEILPGIALSQFDGRDSELFVVSKAGGFGGDDVLPAISERLRRFQ